MAPWLFPQDNNDSDRFLCPKHGCSGAAMTGDTRRTAASKQPIVQELLTNAAIAQTNAQSVASVQSNAPCAVNT